MKPVRNVAVYGTALLALALCTLLFHWPWEKPAFFLGMFLVLLALNFGRAKLVKALAPKRPLAAKIGPDLAIAALGIWGIEAKVCGNRGNPWLEICTAAILFWVAWRVLIHFRDKLSRETPEESAH